MIALLGWTLVHASWQCGVIAAAVAAALWLTRRAAPSTRYAIGLMGLALMVVAPVVTTLARGEGTSRTVVDTVMRTAPVPAGLRASVQMSAGAATLVPQADRTSRARLLGARIDAILPWLVGIWLVGVAALSVRVLAGVADVLRLGRRGVSVVDAHLRSVAGVIAARLGIHNAVRVLQSASVDVPMVVGWVKPAVLVPASLLAGIAPAQLEMLLAHELAHIRRYDTIVNLAQTIVETLLFYHPAVWWVSARVREERENCCDDLAIATTGHDRGAYGAMLLVLEESRMRITLAAAATDGSLLRRVRRIALGSSMRVDLGASWFAGVATMLTVLCVAALGRAPAAAARVSERAIVPAVTPVPQSSSGAPTTRRQIASAAPTVQHPSRSATMNRSSSTLVAGLAVLTAAAANVNAQAAPNLSGRWMVVADSTDSTLGWTNVSGDASAPRAYVFEQTGQWFTMATDAAPIVKSTFAIEASDATTVRVRGPYSVSLLGINVDVTIDPLSGAPHLRAEWSGGSVDLSSLKGDVNLGTLTLTLDANGEMIVQTDLPAVGGQPAKHVVARLRRA